MKTSRVALIVVAFLALASGVAAAAERRESGTVVDVRRDAITIEIMGPWRGPGTGLERRQVRLTPQTAVRLVKRVNDDGAAWPNDFGVTPLAPSALRPGEFVTVTLADAARDVAAVVDVFPPSA
jgi:hypothetical protein